MRLRARLSRIPEQDRSQAQSFSLVWAIKVCERAQAQVQPDNKHQRFAESAAHPAPKEVKEAASNGVATSKVGPSTFSAVVAGSRVAAIIDRADPNGKIRPSNWRKMEGLLANVLQVYWGSTQVLRPIVTTVDGTGAV